MSGHVDQASVSSYHELGFEPMDAIHREFVGILASLAQTGNEGEQLVALHEHLLRHCSLEERWMRATNFPGAAAHSREHEVLLEVVAEVRRRFDAGDSEIVVRLARELPRWFETHANEMDAGLAAHLRGSKFEFPDSEPRSWEAEVA